MDLGETRVKVSNVYKHRRNVSKIWPNPNMIFVLFSKAGHLTCKHEALFLVGKVSLYLEPDIA